MRLTSFNSNYLLCILSFVFILKCRKCEYVNAVAINAKRRSTCDNMINRIDPQHPLPDLDAYNTKHIEGSDVEKSGNFWLKKGQATLRKHLRRKMNANMAKNVIYFLGDGMSLATVTAARIYDGQQKGSSGEANSLSFEKFPHIGLSKTYCIDKLVSDSACTATAYLSGVKANYFTIGVSGNVRINDCEAANKPTNHAKSILSWAQKAGKATGIVTTTRITHASPAGAFAHIANREFECDADIVRFGQNATVCRDIAKQLILDAPGRDFDVIFGGGRKKFIDRNAKDEAGHQGQRHDGIDLIDIWKRKNPDGKYLHDREGLKNLKCGETAKVLGLFSSDQMSYNLDADREKEPSLEEMTVAAVNILSEKENGYVLFVEGGRIDHGHHDSLAHKALDETVEFSKAIQAAVDLTDSSDTLIVVTSDHSHTMSIAGYPARGTNILGLNTDLSDVDLKPYTILNYANGRGYKRNRAKNGGRLDLADIKLDKNFEYPGTFPSSSETHGGDDVGVFAQGPMSHLFTGVYEQNAIPHLIGYIACIGGGETACNGQTN